MVFQTPSRPRWLSRGSCLWFVWLSHKLAAQLSGMQTVPPQRGEGAVEGPVSLSSPVVSTAARTGLSLMAGAGEGGTSDYSPSMGRPPQLLEAPGRPPGLQHHRSPPPPNTVHQGKACQFPEEEYVLDAVPRGRPTRPAAPPVAAPGSPSRRAGLSLQGLSQGPHKPSADVTLRRASVCRKAIVLEGS